MKADQLNKPASYFLIAYNLSGMDRSQIVPTDRAKPLLYTVRNTQVDSMILESSLSLKEEYEYHIIPCFSSTYANCFGYEAKALERETSDRKDAKEITLASIGDYPESKNKSKNDSTDKIMSDIDFWKVKGINKLFIQFRILADNVDKALSHPWLLSVYADKIESHNKSDNTHTTVYPLPVPQKSQMAASEQIRHRICSPTSVSMVVDYYHKTSSIMEMSRLTYNKKYDMYGVWPAGIWAASRYGLLGYIYRFTEWQEVIRLLDRKIPVIASIQYDEGELTGAPMRKTEGHLVVIKGIGKSHVIVNDPAAPDVKSVERAFDLHEFTRHWLMKKGIGYVLFCPSDDKH